MVLTTNLREIIRVSGNDARDLLQSLFTVSYTHLTLPTIYSV